jgi:hypothetical protein
VNELRNSRDVKIVYKVVGVGKKDGNVGYYYKRFDMFDYPAKSSRPEYSNVRV